MNRLTDDEVLHIAELARLKLSDDEVLRFSYQLKSLMDEIDRISCEEIDLDEGLISPCKEACALRDDTFLNSPDCFRIIDNAPVKFDNFIEVAGVFDE